MLPIQPMLDHFGVTTDEVGGVAVADAVACVEFTVIYEESTGICGKPAWQEEEIERARRAWRFICRPSRAIAKDAPIDQRQREEGEETC